MSKMGKRFGIALSLAISIGLIAGCDDASTAEDMGDASKVEVNCDANNKCQMVDGAGNQWPCIMHKDGKSCVPIPGHCEKHNGESCEPDTPIVCLKHNGDVCEEPVDLCEKHGGKYCEEPPVDPCKKHGGKDCKEPPKHDCKKHGGKHCGPGNGGDNGGGENGDGDHCLAIVDALCWFDHGLCDIIGAILCGDCALLPIKVCENDAHCDGILTVIIDLLAHDVDGKVAEILRTIFGAANGGDPIAAILHLLAHDSDGHVPHVLEALLGCGALDFLGVDVIGHLLGVLDALLSDTHGVVHCLLGDLLGGGGDLSIIAELLSAHLNGEHSGIVAEVLGFLEGLGIELGGHHGGGSNGTCHGIEILGVCVEIGGGFGGDNCLLPPIFGICL